MVITQNCSKVSATFARVKRRSTNSCWTKSIGNVVRKRNDGNAKKNVREVRKAAAEVATIEATTTRVKAAAAAEVVIIIPLRIVRGRRRTRTVAPRPPRPRTTNLPQKKVPLDTNIRQVAFLSLGLVEGFVLIDISYV